MTVSMTEFEAEPEGCGFFTVRTSNGTVIAREASRQECHDTFFLSMDCLFCKGGEGKLHKYEEPDLGSDLTDCLNSCGLATTHEGPCK